MNKQVRGRPTKQKQAAHARRIALATQRAAARALNAILVEPPYEDAMDHAISFDFERWSAEIGDAEDRAALFDND